MTFKIIEADGKVRTVSVEPGEGIELAPGETVVLAPETLSEFAVEQQEGNLVLRTPDGEVFTLENFFTGDSSAPATMLGYFDGSDFNVIYSGTGLVSSAILAVSDEGFTPPEALPLPEEFGGPDNAGRAAALRQLFPNALGGAGEGGSGTGSSGGGWSEELDSTEIFAGSLDQGPSLFELSAETLIAREGQSITLTITRSGNLSGTDTVDFRTTLAAGDTASAADFSALSGTLTFLPSEVSKTVVVELTADSPSVEPNETFTVEILNAATSRSGGAATIVEDQVRLTIESNDVPENTVPGAQVTAEDTPIVFTGATALAVSDADGGPITVSLSADNGTFQAGAAVPGVTVTGAGSGQMTLVGTAAAITAALDGAQYQPGADFAGADTIVVTSDDGVAVDTDSIAVTVTPVQDAPTLNPAAPAALNAVLEEAAAPVGAVGTPVSQLVALGGALNNVSDPDGPALGIAIVFLDTTQGTWFHSIDNGASWIASGAVDNANSLLLSSVGGRVYFQPTAADFSGDVPGALVFHAWDQSTGTNGTKVDTSVSGGASAFSAATDAVTVTVTNVNDAPVLNAAAAPVLADADEDSGAPSGAVGTAVADIVANGSGVNNVADPDGPGLGIAVTALDTADGQWWFSTNGGASWSLVGAVADTNALLLSATNGRLFFEPTTAEFNGLVGNAITFRAWDETTGTNGAKADTSANGDPTAFSSATDSIDLTVTALNDAPVNTIGNANVATLEDMPVVLGGADAISVSDSDAGGAPLQVTLSVANGTLVLAGTTGLTGDTDGSDGIISIGGTIANLNAALDGLSYQGLLGFNGVDTLTVTTSDQGNTGNDPGLTGGPADERDVDTVTITVTGQNDTPVLNAALTPTLVAVDEDAGIPTGAVGTAVSDLAAIGSGIDNVTDPDGPGVGIAITALDGSNGQWWYSTDDGVSWSMAPAVSPTSALLLSGTNGRLYFQGNAEFEGTVANAVTFTAWDEFTGTAGGFGDTTTAGTPEAAFSLASDTAAITVTAINDTPEIDLAGGTMQGGLEDTPVVFSLGGGNRISLSDVDVGGDVMTLSLSVSNGTLTLASLAGLTGDVDGLDGTIVATGTLANLNLALDGLSYTGLLGFSGADTLTVTINDQGNNGIDPGTTGGAGDEEATATVALDIVGQNDTPVLNAALTPVLAGVDEDAAAPVGAVGTLVSDLVANGSGIDNVSDPDGPALGIAVTALDTANGQWWFSTDDGASWSLAGPVSDSSALLLGSADRLYFEGNADFSGAVAGAVTFKAWDTFSNADWTGTNGTQADTTLAFAESPFSTATDTADVTVNAVNDTPVNTVPGAQNATEDTPLVFNAGNGNLISVSDVDAGGDPLTVTL
ncbi:MAG: beta strand repeat-containing protein, partial [Gammaproteobacteria bacterium]